MQGEPRLSQLKARPPDILDARGVKVLGGYALNELGCPVGYTFQTVEAAETMSAARGDRFRPATFRVPIKTFGSLA